MSLNCITSCKRAGYSPISPSTDNFSPFCRNVWQYVGILLTAQNTAPLRCGGGKCHWRTVSARPKPFFHSIFAGSPLLSLFVSARCGVHALSKLCQPAPHDHDASYCRSGAGHLFRPEDVMRTGFHATVRDSTRCLTGDRLRLSPDGFWCQNHRESDPGRYLR